MAYRSVHNVRIERLWVDVTAQLGASWAEAFTQLELHHGLDINNTHHIWLLHLLFLPTINQELTFFAESWNQHRIQIRNGPNRSPADLFGFDMLVHGIRGSQLGSGPNDNMTEEELEVFGVDWEGLREDNILQSLRRNAVPHEPPTSWIGRVGPPEHLNEVNLEPPMLSIPAEQLNILDEELNSWALTMGNISIESLWDYGLVSARTMYGDLF